jgi:hypothetical protein
MVPASPSLRHPKRAFFDPLLYLLLTSRRGRDVTYDIDSGVSFIFRRRLPPDLPAATA